MSDENRPINFSLPPRTPDQFSEVEIRFFRHQLGPGFEQYPDSLITEEMSRVERAMNCPALIFADAIITTNLPINRN